MYIICMSSTTDQVCYLQYCKLLESGFHSPKACMDEIESMCSALLWSGSPNQTHKAKVAWDDLCYPKDEGGLGIRKLRDSSMVFAMSLICKKKFV